MMIRSAASHANLVGLRIAGAVAGTLGVLLALLVLVRPEMGVAMLHKAMAMIGF